MTKLMQFTNTELLKLFNLIFKMKNFNISFKLNLLITVGEMEKLLNLK